MIKRFASFSLIFFISLTLLFSGDDKKKRTYELIYEDVQLLKQKIIKLEKRIHKNSEDIEAIKKNLQQLINLTQLLQSEQTGFLEEQKKIPAQYQVLLEKIELMNARLSDFSQQLYAIKKSSLTPLSQLEEKKEIPETEKKKKQEQTPPQKEDKKEKGEKEPPSQAQVQVSPQELYNNARSDYLKGNFQLAIESFTLYLENFPQSPLADNAVYWIGECYFSQEQYQEAIQQFDNLIISYPQGDKVAAAYLKKGICLNKLGEKEKALAVFKLLISKFPLEEETKIAQQKIKEISEK